VEEEQKVPDTAGIFSGGERLLGVRTLLSEGTLGTVLLLLDLDVVAEGLARQDDVVGVRLVETAWRGEYLLMGQWMLSACLSSSRGSR
jgi:hypothetical protein